MPLVNDDAVFNNINMGNVYPGTGPTLGAELNPMMMGQPVEGVEVTGATPDPGAQEVVQAAAVGAQGSAAAWWLVLAISLFLLMFVAKRFGSQESSFSNIKLTVYNVVVIAFAAIIGSTILKAFFTKVKIPGLSSLIIAS